MWGHIKMIKIYEIINVGSRRLPPPVILGGWPKSALPNHLPQNCPQNQSPPTAPQAGPWDLRCSEVPKAAWRLGPKLGLVEAASDVRWSRDDLLRALNPIRVDKTQRPQKTNP